jgi:hypothetical protein
MRYFSYRRSLGRYCPVVTTHRPGTSLSDKEMKTEYFCTHQLVEGDEMLTLNELMEKYPPPDMAIVDPDPPRLDLEKETWGGASISAVVADLRDDGDEDEAELIEALLALAKVGTPTGV